MGKEFNYERSLNLIKAGLFDIYENQEKQIGTIENEKERKKHLEDFINLKNIALMLVEGIEYLYEDSSELENKQEKKEDLSVEEQDIEQEKTTENNYNSIEPGIQKYYLQCGENQLHFAYVSTNLYNKLKKYGESYKDSVPAETDLNEDSSSEAEKVNKQVEEKNDNEAKLLIKDNTYYKEDDEKVRGIIVRSDQFMKLSLSRNRQEGVLEEAKQFRRDEVIKKRKEEQAKKLEEAEVKLDI